MHSISHLRPRRNSGRVAAHLAASLATAMYVASFLDAAPMKGLAWAVPVLGMVVSLRRAPSAQLATVVALDEFRAAVSHDAYTHMGDFDRVRATRVPVAVVNRHVP